MPSANTVAELQVVVSADTSKAESGLSSLNTKLGSTGSMLSTAFAGAAVAGVAALGAAFVSCVSSASAFEKQISAIAAVSGASSDELAALSATALQLGKDTSFSASEAAKGMEELVKAGISVNDVIGGAGRAALDLAAAGAVEVADAAEIAANAMNVFNLTGADMAHVADQIAGAANASAIDVNDYKFSLAAAGAVAATVGIGFEDLTTAIAAMGNAGIKGSDAGTSLKTMLMNLQPSTKKQTELFRELGIITADGSNQFFDATGKAKSFAQIAQVLQNALAGMTDQQRLAALETMFGSDAIRAAAVIAKEGSAGFEELAASIGKISAQQVAETRLDNLAGSMEKLTGSLETGAIIIGKAFTPALKAMVDGLTQLVNDATPAIERFAAAFSAAVVLVTGDAEKAGQAFDDVSELLSDAFGPELSGQIAQTLQTLRSLLTEFSQTMKTLFADTTTATGATWKNANTLMVQQITESTRATLQVLRVFLAAMRGDWDTAWEALLEADQAHRNAQVAQAERQSAVLLGTIEKLTGGALSATVQWWTDTTTAFERGWADLVAATERGTTETLAPIVDAWDRARTTTETVWRAIMNVLTAVWAELEREVVAPAVAAIQRLITDAWDAISRQTHAVFDPWIRYVRETIFGPAQTVIETVMTAASEAVKTALDAISSTAHQILDPLLRWWTDTIWNPMAAAVATAMTGARGAQTSFTDAVNQIKATVDGVMRSAHDAWMTMWAAIERAAQSPAAALETVREAVRKLKDIMPDWLIPHSPTPFEMGIRGIADAVGSMGKAFSRMGDAVGDSGGKVRDYIIEAARARDIDPSVALRIARHEGGEDDYMQVGRFKTGYSFWPFQLHYAMRGMPGVTDPTAGMGDDFTKRTGWQAGDWRAWKASIDFALDHARRRGWGAWYGRGPAGVGAWEGIPGHAAGGWVGLRGPELGWLGERGPEYVIPNHALGGGRGGIETHQFIIRDPSGQTLAEWYVTGRETAIRYGRATA